ncbi:hypothetical protein Q1695_016138 [Nippostrongylus brasiliensis]|nr:hypothetical protein Q1695_016138 [Nippostrongylus brasiliensis]
MWAGPPYGRYMNLSDINCGGGGSVTSYNDWGTIAQAVPLGGTNQCGTMSTKDVVSGWFQEILPYVTANSLTFNGKGDSFAKFAKWNATQMACVYRPCTDAANAGNQFLYCAFNVNGAVTGQDIYEQAGANDNYCGQVDPAKQLCSGTCSKQYTNLCITNAAPPPAQAVLDFVLPNTTATECFNLNPRSDQFFRYTALMMHNYYRKQVARGWAKDKSGYIPPAASMNELTFDCDYLNKTYSLLVDNKCSDSIINTFTGDRAVLFKSFNDTSISAVDALQQAISGWYEELSNVVIGDNPTLTSGLNSTIWNVANVIHDKSTKFACNINYCTNVMVACQYDQPFVEVDKAIYEAGPTCSKCAGGKCGVANSFC